jgi:hypothetical protein
MMIYLGGLYGTATWVCCSGGVSAQCLQIEEGIPRYIILVIYVDEYDYWK